MSLYSVIIPCYKSSATIEKVVRLTSEELERLGRNEYEFVLVNDCSPDGGETIRALRETAEKYPFVTVIDLAKNVGQHNALMAALNYARGDYIIAMDDDMQTRPSELSKLFDELEKGYDVVYGYYPEKKHGFFRNIASFMNYISVRVLIGKPKELKTSSYWVMRKFVRDSIIQYTNRYAYMQGLVLRTTSNISCVPIQHFEREEGVSGYTWKSLFRLWKNIIGFSIVPLKLATYSGYLSFAAGIIGALIIFIKKLINPDIPIGYSSTMVTILIFSGLNMLFVGLVGEYVGRTFLGINKEPQFVVKEIINEKEKEK